MALMKVTFTVDNVSPDVDKTGLLIAVEEDLLNFGHKTRTGLDTRLRSLKIEFRGDVARSKMALHDEKVL